MSTEQKSWPGVGLLLVDIQNDFIDGSLAVKGAESILPTVKRLIEDYPFQVIISSQDFHPPSHISFASRHSSEPFKLKRLPHPIASKAVSGETIDQMMWPDHCVQNTRGCEFNVEVSQAIERKVAKGGQSFVVQKGTNVDVDGYSAFSSNNYVNFTELPKILFSQQPPIHTLVVVGLATDHCVLFSAIDAVKFQLQTIVVEDGIRGVRSESSQKSHKEMRDWGIQFVQSDSDLHKVLP